MSAPHYNVVIVGTGPGGYVAAIRAAQLGLKTAVVEKDELGGTCLNWGCIPTKAWIVTAHLLRADQARQGVRHRGRRAQDQLGLSLVERKNKVVKQLTGGVGALLKGRSVDIYRGAATAPSAGELPVSPERMARPSRDLRRSRHPRHRRRGDDAAGLVKLDGERVITSKEALDLTKQPRASPMLGGGVVGTEFACFFAAIGSQVTLIEMLPRLVPAEDDEIAVGARARDEEAEDRAASRTRRSRASQGRPRTAR